MPVDPADTALPASCQGTSLDLDALLESKACDTSEAAGPPPAETAIDATIEPVRPTLRPGETIALTLRITNRTTEPLRLDLNVTQTCSPFHVSAYDQKGERADIEDVCGMLAACGRRVLRVRLDRGGSMTKKLEFSATVSRESEDCEPLPSRAMRPGMYRLVAGLPFSDAEDRRKTSTVLVVR